MKKKFTFLIAALMLLTMINLPGKAVGQTRGDLCNYNTFTGWPQASYANSYTYTNSEGEWGFTGAYRPSPSTASFQIKKNTSNFVLTTPTFAENIGTVTVTFSAGAGTVYVKDDSDNSLGNSSFSSSNPAVIDISSSTVKKIKICVTENNTATCQLTQLQITDNSGAITQTLTFGFSSNPGDWPTSNSTTLTNYDYTLNAVTYTFALKNVKCNSGYLMMTNTAALGLPAIANYKLIKVVAKNTNGCSTSTRVGISSSSSSATYISGGAYQTWSTQGSSYTYNLSSTSVNTVYYMYVTNANAQVTELKLTYEYVAPNYTVSFDCDGGEGCHDDITDIEPGDDNFTVPNDTPTKDCNTFDGFYYNAADENDLYEVGKTYTIEGDLELVASWTLNKYTVTYYSNNGETGEDVAVNNLECGSAYTIADDPGFTQPQATPNFVNWNTQPDGNGTTYSVGQGITISGNLSLYAQWSAVATYTVTYAPDTGATGSNVVDNNVSGSYTVRANDGENGNPAFSKEGYTFKCWNNGSNDVNAGSNITVSSNVTLTAQWLENLANPTFNVTGVSNGTANTYYATANVTIQAADGATIYYTTDGTDPTTSSSVYSSAITVNTEGTNTIKAFATKSGNGPSAIASQTVIIVNRADATFTDGVYSESFSSSLGLWYAYNVTGDKVWAQGSVTASQVTYTGANINGYQENNEDWLISPKMTAENGKVVVSFSTVARYNSSNYTLVVKYSTNYNGYGAPSGATWKALNPTIATAPNSGFSSWTSSGNVVISELSTSTDPLTNSTPIYLAFVYTSATGSGNATQYFIKDFSAKQCYPITYDANGGSGTTADANSPYAVGTEVTILNNAFTAPEGKEFTEWNTLANGTGTLKNPGQKITMTTAGYELYAIWGDACVLAAEMNATTGAAAYNYNGGNKRFDINLSSSVKTLGGCDIYDYGFVYSTTATSPTVDGLGCTKVQVGTTQPTVNVAFEATLEDVTKEATYYVRSYATNNAGTAYSNPISVTVPAAFPTWTISYTTNGTADGSTTVEQGDKISGLKAAPTAANVPSGYTFMGWYGYDYALSNTAPTFVKNGDAISGNITLKAVFAIAGANNSTTGELTQSEITSNITSSACAYGTEKTYEDTGDGINWIASCFADQGRLWMQIKKDASDSYIKVVAPDVITNVEVLMTSSSNSSGGIADITKHTAFSGTVYLATSAGTSSTGNVGSMSSSNFDGNYANINPTGNNSTLYIQVTGGAARIWGISVTYGGVEYSSYCTSVSPQTAISGTISAGHLTTDGTIAANTAVSITGLTINSGVTLTVNGVISTANPSDLVIEDGGRLIVYNEGVQATVKKEVEGAGETNWSATSGAEGWYFIASPVNGADFPAGTYDDQDIFQLDWASTQWLNLQNSGNSTLFNAGFQRGTGYLYASKEDLQGNNSLSFAGEIQPLNNEHKATVALAVDGWNLIGNPLTCKVTVDCPFRVLNDEGSATIAVEKDNDINPCQGIAVYGDANDVVTFTKATSQDASAPSNNNSLQMTLAKKVTSRGEASTEVVDNAIVSFNESKGMPKFNMLGGSAKLYIPQNDEEYSVVFSDKQGDLPLNFKADEIGTYTINFETNDRASLQGIYLIDILEQKEIDLSVNPSYTFIGSPADRTARFKIVFRNVNGDSTSDIFAYQSGNDIIVSGEGELQIFDVMGRLVKTQHVNGVQTINVNAQGVYIMKLNEKTQKIVVR